MKTNMSMTANGQVLLFKGAKEGDKTDPYVEALKTAQYDASVIAALGFKFVNLDQLRTGLRSPDNYSCLVLSSPRTAESVRRAFDTPTLSVEWFNVLAPQWAAKQTFVVGGATATAALSLGLKPSGADSGNAANLASRVADELIKQEITNRGVLLPCGQLSLEILPNILKQRGLSVKCLTVYETVANEYLSANIKSYIETKGLPKYVVFFSPSAVNFSKPLIDQYGCVQDSAQLIAIGPTTEAAIKESFGRVSGTAEHPTAHHVCQVIQQLAMTVG